MSWLLIHAHTNKEHRAEQSIAEAGENPWLPLATGGFPAYPGYLFTELQDHTRPHEISGLPGVIRVVRFGETLATANNELIDALKQTEWTRDTLAPGCDVIITEGPFAHYTGQAVKITGHIVDIVIEMMHRPQTLRVSTNQVEVA